jgi:hypothetical protein
MLHRCSVPSPGIRGTPSYLPCITQSSSLRFSNFSFDKKTVFKNTTESLVNVAGVSNVVSENNAQKKKIIGSVPDKHKVGKLVFFWEN